MGKKVLFIVMLAVCLCCFGAVYAADDSDFMGTWVLKSIIFDEYGLEVDPANFGITGSLEITEDTIITETDGEITEVKWTRKFDNTITASVETGGSIDFYLEGDTLISKSEDENGIVRMTYERPSNTCDCAELQKQIEVLKAELEVLKNQADQ